MSSSHLYRSPTSFIAFGPTARFSPIISNKEVTDIRQDDSVSHAVITTWQISFDQIQKTTPEVADLHALMAMFDRQANPDSIVSDGSPNLQLEGALSPLSRYFLINVLATKKKDSQF